MRCCVIVERLDVWMTIENRLNDPALHATPASVNDANLAKPRADGRLDVSLDDRRDVARRERVQVDVILDGDAVRLVHYELPAGGAASRAGAPPCRKTRGPFSLGR